MESRFYLSSISFVAKSAFTAERFAAQQLLSHDFDRDGQQDLIVRGQRQLVIIRSDDANSWKTQEPIAPHLEITDAALTDLDEDGFTDIFVASPIGTYLLPGSSTGQFGAPKLLTGGFDRAWLADRDGDGDMDVFGTQSGNDRFTNLSNENVGKGRFLPTHYPGPDVEAPEALSRHILVDVDGDLDIDVAYIDDQDRVFWQENVAGTLSLPSLVADLQVGPARADILRHDSITSVVEIDGAKHLVTSDERGVIWTGPLHEPFQQPLVIDSRRAYRLRVADLNDDGASDLIAVTPTGIDWYANQATGFDQPQSILKTTTNSVISIDPADLDGDGLLDMLVTRRVGDTFSVDWLRNEGTQFTSPLLIHSDFTHEAIAIDYDGDGDRDVLFTGHLAENIDGKGDFRLTPLRVFPAAFTRGDMDNDGDEDLLLIQSDGAVQVWRHDSDSNYHVIELSGFQALHVFNLRGQASFADLDGDGDLDVIVGVKYGTGGSFVSQGLRWFENLSDGSFSPPIELGIYATSFSAVDWEGDGDLDLIAAGKLLENRGDPQVSFWLPERPVAGAPIELELRIENRSIHRLDHAIVKSSLPLSHVTWQCSGSDGVTCRPSGVGDIDDVVVVPADGVVTYHIQGLVRDESQTVSIDASLVLSDLFVDSDPANNYVAMDLPVASWSVDSVVGPLPTITLTAPLPGNYRAVLTGELSGAVAASISGSGEKLVISPATPLLPGERFRISILHGDEPAFAHESVVPVSGGTGAFTKTEKVWRKTDVSNLAVADLNKDGRVDVLVGGYGDDDFLLFNAGQSEFAAVAAPNRVSYQPTLIDWNLDGDVDFFNGLSMWENDGSGAFRLEDIGLQQYSSWGHAINDLDGDGDSDVILFHSGAGFPMLNEQQPFLPMTAVPVPDSISWTKLVDFDQDSKVDLLTHTASSSLHSRNPVTQLHRGLGAGRFQPATRLDLPLQVELMFQSAPQILDVDQDGDLDILALDEQRFAVLKNNGHGQFQVAQTQDNAGWQYHFADFDGDLDLDFVYVNDGVHLWTNDGTGEFSWKRKLDEELHRIAIADFDSDGDLDIFGHNLISNTSHLFLNNDRWNVADVDEDGAVGFSDFLALSANFGQEDASWREADLNGDQRVGLADLLILADQFGARRE